MEDGSFGMNGQWHHEFDSSNSWGTEDALPVCVDQTIDRWAGILRREDPWSGMPLDDLAGEMRAVGRALVNAGFEPEEVRRERLVRAGREHGLFRHAQRLPRQLLSFELLMLREVMTNELRGGELSDALLRLAMDNLKPDIRLVRNAAERAWSGQQYHME
jgi:hypothetical protein